MTTSSEDASSGPTTAGYLLTILPRFTAFLSMFGSIMIISSVLRSKKNRENMQQRIVCAMSAFDLMFSTSLFFTIFLVPESFKADRGFPIALGNQASCVAQGFMNQFSIASPIYNATLSLYYLLVIKYNWGNARLSKVEKYFHIVPIGFGLITATTVASMGLIGNATFSCWIFDKDRMYLSRVLQFTLFYAVIWASMIIAMYNMVRIYLYIRETELRTSRWRAGGDCMAQTKSVAKQNQLYILGFIFTFFFPTVARLMGLARKKPPQWLMVTAGTVIPSNGFFNALIYFRLRYKKCRSSNQDKKWYWSVGQVILLTLFPCVKNEHNIADGKDLEEDLTDTHISTESDEHQIKHDNHNKASNRVKRSLIGSSTQVSLNAGASQGWKTLKNSGIKTINKDSASIKTRFPIDLEAAVTEQKPAQSIEKTAGRNGSEEKESTHIEPTAEMEEEKMDICKTEIDQERSTEPTNVLEEGNFHRLDE